MRALRLATAVAIAAFAAWLSGCAAPAPQPSVPAVPATTVVLLPQAGGAHGAVAVDPGSRALLLTQPYAAAVDDDDGLRSVTLSPAQVQSRFGAAMAALPERASRFTLYFVEGRDTLTDASQRLVDRTLAEIAARPVPDVLVVGHTDAVGSHAANDALSLQRAQLIRSELMRLGVAADSIQVIARGKRELAVDTADGVAEPRNRRVEIVVR